MSALILVVDDEPDVAELFRQQFRKELRASRFDMEFAQSAPEALELVGSAESGRLWRFGNAAEGDRGRRSGPLHQADRLSRIARRDRPPAGRRDGSPMTAKVLVVDDEPDLEDLIRQKFRRQIKDGSIAFGFARDGVEALAFLAENRDFDMVVSDINMPRMDGLTLLAKMQDEATRFSTVIVSAYGDMANIRTAMNRGAFDFLTKPIDFADFETTLRKTIAHVADLKDARARQAAAERAHASLSRYFSPNLALSLAADANALAPGGERREIATMFTDIADFTPLVESLDPEELASLLSGYLEGMTEIVFAHEGTVAKIIGDAIHVLFGAPAEQPDAANRAIACALELDAYGDAAILGVGLFSVAFHRRAIRAIRLASAFTPDRRSSATSVAGGCSTTRLTATPSTPRRGSRRSTSSSAPAFASARSPPSGPQGSLADRSAISGCAAGRSRCAPTSRWRRKTQEVRPRRRMPAPSPSSKRATRPRSPPSPRWSA